MKTFKVNMKIRAECKDDAIELLEEYTGTETYIEIIDIKEVKGDI